MLAVLATVWAGCVDRLCDQLGWTMVSFEPEDVLLWWGSRSEQCICDVLRSQGAVGDSVSTESDRELTTRVASRARVLAGSARPRRSRSR